VSALFVRAFLPEMRARAHGHVVTLGSVADRSAFPENGAYAASKDGVRAVHGDVLGAMQRPGRGGAAAARAAPHMHARRSSHSLASRA
jgi:hypothetical protein